VQLETRGGSLLREAPEVSQLFHTGSILLKQIDTRKSSLFMSPDQLRCGNNLSHEDITDHSR
jgi:hypothetical protein